MFHFLILHSSELCHKSLVILLKSQASKLFNCYKEKANVGNNISVKDIFINEF